MWWLWFLNQNFHCSTAYHRPHTTHKVLCRPVLDEAQRSRSHLQLFTLMIASSQMCSLCASVFLIVLNPSAKFPQAKFKLGFFEVCLCFYLFIYLFQRDYAPLVPCKLFWLYCRNFIILWSSPLCTLCPKVENGRANSHLESLLWSVFAAVWCGRHGG